MKFSTYLTEGLIKLPSKMFDDGRSYIVSQICSYALTEIKKIKEITPLMKKVEDHLQKTAQKYNAKVKMSRKMEHTKTVLAKVYDDLPEKYKQHAQEYKKGLTLWIDWNNKGEFVSKNGYFRNTDEGVIGVSIFRLVSYDWAKMVGRITTEEHSTSICEAFDRNLERILGTFEHELTHFVQKKILPHEDKQFTKNTVLGKSDAYLNSKVEFDPMVKDEIRSYLRQEKENLEIKMDKRGRSNWIAAFVGSKTFKEDPKRSMMDLPDEVIGYIKPSRFFASLKKHSEKRWKLACKLFTQEVEKRAP